MVRKIGNELKVSQDFFGNFGMYMYENKDSKYFALSNSFLLLEEYLSDKQHLTLNKDFADNFITSELCTPSIYETLIQEILQIPSSSSIIINQHKREFTIISRDYEENTIQWESEKGLELIDKWADKWGYIFRSLKKKTNNFFTELSGGFDSRVVLSILLKSGIDKKDLLINSNNDKLRNHEEDFNIANNISSKLGLKINNYTLDNNGTILSLKDSLICSFYTKLGIHKQFNLQKKFYNKPRFRVTGFGGENIRGYPNYPIQKYLEMISERGKKILGHEEEFFNSSMRLCNRSVYQLKNQNIYNDDYEISSAIYKRGRARNHFGKVSLEGFLANIYCLNPLLDKDLMKIKYNTSKSHDEFLSYIFVRFSPDLINFQFEGNRTLNINSIKKAQKINKKIPNYKIKSDYNDNFYIDIERLSPVIPSIHNTSIDGYIKDLFKSTKFYSFINNIYDMSIYKWAKDYCEKQKFHPMRHGYGLLAIATSIKCISLNNLFSKKSKKKKQKLFRFKI